MTRPPAGATFFTIAAIVVATTSAATTFAPAFGGRPLVAAWLTAGAAAPLGAIVALVLARALPRERAAWAAWTAVGTYLLAAGMTAAAAHRFIAIPCALAVGGAAWAFLPRAVAPARLLVVITLSAVGTWVTALPLTFTPFEDWLLAGAWTTGFADAGFTVAVVFATGAALHAFRGAPRARPAIVSASIAIAFFALQGLRTDGLGLDWLPYHRSYYAGPAEFVRAGHWLLWDVPAQYGFFSTVTIALLPLPTTLQSLWLLTAIMLTVSAAITFSILRHRIRGVAGWFAALAITYAAIFSDQAWRAPFGARMYPQHGLRFPFLVAILALAFAASSDRRNAGRWRLAAAAFCAWSFAWSFDSFAWTLFVWLAYTVTDLVVDWWRAPRARERIGTAICARLAPLLAGPLVVAGAVETYYRTFLGHGPDWSAYVEFVLAYSTDPSFERGFDPFGGGLTLLAAFTAVTIAATLAIRDRHWPALPVLVAAGAGIWIAASYYVLEPFANHVNGSLPFLVCAATVVWTVTARWRGSSIMLARLAFVPMIAVVTATAIGEPGRIARQRFLDTAAVDGAPMPPELQRVLGAAHADPRDGIVVPDRPDWIKRDVGLIEPFVRENGRLRELRPWFPLTPVGERNAFITLPLARRVVYAERYFARDARGGWLVEYRAPADCEALWPGLVSTRRAAGENFNVTRCDARVPGRAGATGALPLEEPAVHRATRASPPR